MKRRDFLKGMVGSAAALPIIAKGEVKIPEIPVKEEPVFKTKSNIPDHSMFVSTTTDEAYSSGLYSGQEIYASASFESVFADVFKK